MENSNEHADNNKNVDGYKVPGDGNAPNNPPQPGNESFDENPNAEVQHSKSDIPAKEFNTGDKAFHDSSKEDYTETTSKFNHANSEDDLKVNLDNEKHDDNL